MQRGQFCGILCSMHALGMALVVTAVLFGIVFGLLRFPNKDGVSVWDTRPTDDWKGYVAFSGIAFIVFVCILWFLYQYVFPHMA